MNSADPFKNALCRLRTRSRRRGLSPACLQRTPPVEAGKSLWRVTGPDRFSHSWAEALLPTRQGVPAPIPAISDGARRTPPGLRVRRCFPLTRSSCRPG